jgi:hypothetical protein
MAVAPHQLWLLWIYADPMSGKLLNLQYESTAGNDYTTETLTGTATESLAKHTVHASLPAVDIPFPAGVQGYRFSVSGPAVSLDSSGPGTLTAGAASFHVYPFNWVDCSTICGMPGWYEIHALLFDSTGPVARVCPTIFYLHLDSHQVSIAYTLSLPMLDDPAPATTLSGATFLISG